MSKSRKSYHKVYVSLLVSAFAFGAMPATMNFTVDPYQLFTKKDRTTKINDIAEKAHYPLWKLAKFKRGSHDTIILGDSRARALRDKYWHELQISGALNLAYGGGTIPEIYSTFMEIKSDPAIKNLIIGIQLRSFDERHKGGMNRVPEAVHLVRHKIEYLKNWDVFQTTLKVFEKENQKALNKISIIPNAHASELGKEGSTSLSKLLEPDVCFGCELPTDLKSVKYAGKHKSYTLPGHYRHGYGGWNTHLSLRDWSKYEGLYHIDNLLESLPSKFKRQVQKNGKADWRGFQFSKKYWSHFEAIGTWAKANDKKLIFVIPPTITNMQQTIQANGLSKLNHQLRVKLAEFGTVIDLDFPNQITTDTQNFNDAYHFNSKIARQIVGQIVPQISNNRKAIEKAAKRQRDLRCKFKSKTHATSSPSTLVLVDGESCRVWRAAT